MTVDQLFIGDVDGIDMLVMGNESSGESFSIQRAQEFDEQDIELGTNTYCLSNSWGVTHYGGVESFELFDESLDLNFDSQASEVFGFDKINFHVERNSRDYLTLDAAIRRLLDLKH